MGMDIDLGTWRFSRRMVRASDMPTGPSRTRASGSTQQGGGRRRSHGDSHVLGVRTCPHPCACSRPTRVGRPAIQPGGSSFLRDRRGRFARPGGIIPAFCNPRGRTRRSRTGLPPSCRAHRAVECCLRGARLRGAASTVVASRFRVRQCFGAAGTAAGLFCRARIRSISSMVVLISAMAASKGVEVVMSTPAFARSSMAYFELPERSISR